MRSGVTYIDPSPAINYRDNNWVQFNHGMKFIREHAHLIVGPVLDIGCGDGKLTAQISGTFLVPMMGVDISFERISLAKSTYRSVRFAVADAVKLSATPALAGHSYPTVVSFNALHHVPKSQQPSAFSEMKKMMTADGVALLLIPQSGSGVFAALQETAVSAKWLELFADFDLSNVRTHESDSYYAEQLDKAGFYRCEIKAVQEDTGKGMDAKEMVNFLRGWVPHLAHLKAHKKSEADQIEFLTEGVHLYFSKMGKQLDEKLVLTVTQNQIVAFSSALSFFNRKKNPAKNLLADVPERTVALAKL